MSACSQCVTCLFIDRRASGVAVSRHREQALRTRDPMPDCGNSTPNHASLGHQILVRYLTDSEGEQPNCHGRSRRPSQLILTCGFAAKNWGSTHAEPDWLLTFAIPQFMRPNSSAKREPGRRNAYRARGSNAICELRGYFLLRLTVTPAAMQITAATANTMGSVALLVSPVWGSCFAGCSGSLGLAAGAA